MPSKAKMDGEVFGGKRACKVKKGAVLADEWYANKFPDLFERVEAASEKVGADRDPPKEKKAKEVKTDG